MNEFDKLHSIEVNQHFFDLQLTSCQFSEQQIKTKKKLLQQNLISQIIDNDQQQRTKKLRQILGNVKRKRLQNIFIDKLKRNASIQDNIILQGFDKKKISPKFFIRAIQYPQQVGHILIIFNVVSILILIILASLQSFISNFYQNISILAVSILKFGCLFVCILCLIYKCTNRKFGYKDPHLYIHQIVKIYFSSGRLVLDVISIALLITSLKLPYSVPISISFFIILIFALLFTVTDLIKIQTAYLRSQKAVLVWGLVKVFLYNIIIAHIVASVLLGITLLNNQQNWLISIGKDQAMWYVKYLYAIYFASTIILTVGFGDIVPTQDSQVFVVTIIQMFCCIVLAYNISYFGSIIYKIKQKDDMVSKKMVIFDQMVKSREQPQNISSGLQRKITNHIRQLNSGKNRLQFQLKKQLLDQLPEHLRMAYYQQANKRIFSQANFFKMLKQTTIQLIAAKFQSKFFYPGEILFKAKQKILILEQGVIDYTYKKKGSSLNDITFDSISIKNKKTELLTSFFLSLHQTLNYGLVAKSHCIIWRIDFQQFLDTLRTSPVDFQLYCSILNKHEVDEDQWNSIECLRCSTSQKFYHTIFECPRITYRPIKQAIIFKNLYCKSLTNRRISFQRNRNQYTKICFFIHKQQILSQHARFIQNKLFNQSTSHFFDEQYLIHNQNHKKTEQILERARNLENINNMTKQHLLILIEKAVKKYQTGYEDDFWDLQADSAANFNHFFTNQNPIRLRGRYIDQTIPKSKLGSQVLKSASSINLCNQ